MRSEDVEGAQPNKADVHVEDLGTVPYAVIEFFGLFSRLEFALLVSGYAGGEIGGNAWVQWDLFAKDLHKSFFEDVRSDTEAAILFSDPARKLIKSRGDGCTFVANDIPADSVALVLQVRTIRNNLFHGSKVRFTDRDRLLVNAGIRVLRIALRAAELSSHCRKVSCAWAYAEIDDS